MSWKESEENSRRIEKEMKKTDILFGIYMAAVVILLSSSLILFVAVPVFAGNKSSDVRITVNYNRSLQTASVIVPDGQKTITVEGFPDFISNEKIIVLKKKFSRVDDLINYMSDKGWSHNRNEADFNNSNKKTVTLHFNKRLYSGYNIENDFK